MVRLFLLDQYDDAEPDRKKTAAMLAGFVTKTAPEDALLGEVEAADDGTATASLEPGTLQVLLPGEDVEFSARPMSAAATIPDRDEWVQPGSSATRCRSAPARRC